VRSLLPRAWRGESLGPDDPGYLVNPLDLWDGQKGIEHSLYSMIAAWRRRQPGTPQPPSTTLSDANVRDLARLLERYNPFAQGILTALRGYTLADQGMVVELAAREGVTLDEDDPLLAGAQDYLDEYMDRDDWWSRERELYVRCHRDGEGIVRYFAGDDGVRLRFVEPEWVVNPDGSAEWSEGVRTDPQDAETVEALWVQTGATPGDGEEVPADEVYLIRCNVDKCLKRGLSDFASIAPLVMKALDCLTSMIGAESVRQGIVMITQHEASAPADLDAFIAQQTDYSDRSRVYGGQGGPERAVPTQAVGSVREVHLTGQQKLAALPSAGVVADAVNAINTALLSAGARYHMPLWVISGDASRNNAMDLQAEGPFGKFIADEQVWYGRHVRNVLWRVLEIGVDRGELPARALEVLELSVTPQRPTEQRDPTKETDRNATLHENQLLGKPTWAAREGLDFDQEQADLEKYGGPPKPPDEAIPPGYKAIPAGSPSSSEVDPAAPAAVAAVGAPAAVPEPSETPAPVPETPIASPQAGGSAELRGSVGGSQALLDLQKAVYAGAMPREAGIANARIVFGFDQASAEALFPEVKPVATAVPEAPQEVPLA
jgi:hypothetical protein